MSARRGRAARAAILSIAVALGAAPVLALTPAVRHHQVTASLDVPAHRLSATDRVTLAPAEDADAPIHFLLNRNLDVASVTRGGTNLVFTADESWDPRRYWKRPPYAELDGFEIVQEIAVPAPPAGWGTGPIEIEVAYAGVIADSLHSPDRAYGRSFETTSGRIVEPGAFLSGGTFWIPWSGEGLFPFEFTAEGPADWRTMSQGRLTEEGPVPGSGASRYRMTWSCEQPMDEIYFVAGPYEVRRRDHHGVSLETWTYASTPEELSAPYLDAAAEAIDRYAAMLGSYPFSKFALVENYWQTGYGMPGFTFLGDRVIRLPFIIHTSYPHEILHNWWGNSVYVDGGNWCEGLTTYGADYAAKEREGGTAARDYRRDTLLGYRDFASAGGKDFPLARFRERDSAATQAVGYGKTLMVFHMLRRNLGDRVFEKALRRFYQSNRFRKATWDDVRAAFEAEAPGDLGAWFDQWIRRPGAIVLTLEDVSRGPAEGGGVTVRGTLAQRAPVFATSVPVVVEGAEGDRREVTIESLGERTPFELRVPFAVHRVAADPGFDLFRLLHEEEVAPALSGVLGADSTRIVLGADASPPVRQALLALAETWAKDSTFAIREEAEADDDFAGAVWYFGDGPTSRAFRAALPALEPAGGTLVAAGRRDGRADRMAAILWPESADVVPAIGRKTPHYSKYSYLVFDGETNVAKGAWDPGDSPLVVSFGGSR